MSLGRSITKKTSKYGFGTSSEEKKSRRNSVSKSAISGPVELTSTTNPIAYTAPSLRNSLSHASISSSSSSSAGSSPISPGTGSLSPISGDESDLAENIPLHRNHLSSYFTPSDIAAKSSSIGGAVARTRNSSNPPPSASRSSGYSFNPVQQPPKDIHSLHSRTYSTQHHPFGAELAQVQEMAEEIAGMKTGDAEEQFMISRGLMRFNARDYEREIWSGIEGGVFEDEVLLDLTGAAWI
ncbi:hypothetical protein BZA77DRAFT_255155 [Pyronema omphalodes]|nr:hypothetical protein BZA77DRAFT_255155 [Pyronema omphalodes]